MDCADYGGIAICGNFAKVLPKKPINFDYMNTAKWMEDYPFDKRECIGGTVCSCKQIEVHFAPYLGFDHFHADNCNLMRKVRDNPGLMTLWAYAHLPNIRFSKQAIASTRPIRTYVKIVSRKQYIKVRVLTEYNASLFEVPTKEAEQS